jgi:Predicted membrane protein
MNAKSTKLITTVGVFSALAIILYLVDFPVAFLFPAYLKIDFSDVPAILAGVSAGPFAGIMVQLVKNIIHFLMKSETGGVGEMANFIAGSALMLPIAIFYGKEKLKMIPSFAIGTISMVIFANLVNYFITLPLYRMPKETLLPTIISVLIPFNIFKAVLVLVVCGLLMKRTIKFIRK